METPAPPFQDIPPTAFYLVTQRGSAIRYYDILSLLPTPTHPNEQAELLAQDVFHNVKRHYHHSHLTVPQPRSRKTWQLSLENRYSQVIAALDHGDDPLIDKHFGLCAASLAALCIRMLEELNLPLSIPESDHN